MSTSPYSFRFISNRSRARQAVLALAFMFAAGFPIGAQATLAAQHGHTVARASERDISPAGRLFVLSAPGLRGGLSRPGWIAAGGGALHPLGRPSAYAGLSVRRTSALLALGSPAGLALLHADGRAARRLCPAGVPAQIAMPAWSSDGRRLAFLAAPAPHRHTVVERTLWIADADGRNARRVLDARRTADLLTVAWAPDGHALLLSRFARGRGAISLLDLRSLRETALVAGFDAAWSPDGRRIAFDRRGRPGVAHLWVLDLRSHRARQLAVSGLTQAAAPAWSPDGRRLAFFGTAASAPTFLQPYSLWTIPAAGGSPRLVAPKVAALLPVGQDALAWASR